MIVDICKKKPIIKAVISVEKVLKKEFLSPRNTPKGLINAKVIRKIKTVFFEYFVWIKKVVKTIAIGIL